MSAGVAKFASAALLAVIVGCATPGPEPVAPPLVKAITFDGDYQGTIQLTSTSDMGFPRSWCDTPRNITLSPRNGNFQYVLAHPNVPKDSNYSLSPAFAVTIASDGSFKATSQNGDAQMLGRVIGSHMAGEINGSACGYEFAADRS